jgi:hypothetical protein
MISKSPKRGTFQQERSERSLNDPSIPLEERQHLLDLINLYGELQQQSAARELDPNWQKDNMEYDLRTTSWILEKVRTSDTYAQNLYAAMCNNDFIKNDVIPILKEQKWSCSWRYAGGIIADMRQEGDYIDWYCSGIGGKSDYMSEGIVTEEIRADLFKLGWIVVDDDNIGV